MVKRGERALTLISPLKHFNLKASKGFTLVEILIVLAIFARIAAMGIPALFKKSDNIKKVARQLTSLTKEVRNRAKLKNSTYRIVFDMRAEPHRYWVEYSQGSKPIPANLYEEKTDDESPSTQSQRFQKDLTILKKVGNNLTDGSLKDRNTVLEGNGEQNILIIGPGAPLVYTFAIRNLGTVIATGTTTVEDTLPQGITISGSLQNQSGWTCTSGINGNRSWSCSRTEDLAVGASFPTIQVFANSDSAILAGVYSNIATVKNP